MTKIDIVSGFLGAGKTTLIKKLLNVWHSLPLSHGLPLVAILRIIYLFGQLLTSLGAYAPQRLVS